MQCQMGTSCGPEEDTVVVADTESVIVADEVVVSRESEVASCRADVEKVQADLEAFKISITKDMLQAKATMDEQIDVVVKDRTSVLEADLKRLAAEVAQLKAPSNAEKEHDQDPAVSSMAVMPSQGATATQNTGAHKPSKGMQARASVLDFHLAKKRMGELKSYELRETVWDLAFYLGMKAFGPSEEIIVYFTVFLNIVIQVAFIVLVREKMTDGDFNEESIVQNFLDWRILYAHDPKYADAFTNIPLAKGICVGSPNNMEGALQADMYKDVNAYVQTAAGFRSGEILCLLASLLWVFACFRECENTMRLLSSVWATVYYSGRPELPWFRRILSARSSASFIEEEIVTVEDGDVACKSIKFSCSFLRGCVATGCLIIPRLAILIALGYVGATFLVAYIELSEFLLNSVALEVVLNVDELLFDIFVPYIPKMILAKTFPLHRSKALRFVASGYPYMKIMLVTVVVLMIRFILLSPIIKNIEDVERVMCGGNQDFLAAEISIGSVFAGFVAAGSSEINRDKYSYRAILQKTGLEEASRTGSQTLYLDSRAPPLTSLFPIPDVFQARVYQGLTVGEMANAGSHKTYTLRCHSDTFWKIGHPYAGDSITDLMAEVFAPTHPNCSSLLGAGYCVVKSKQGTVARFFCPKSCGLSDPQSGNAFFGGEEGVPKPECEKQVGSQLKNETAYPCQDLPKTSPAFATLALSMTNLLHDALARFGNASYVAMETARFFHLLGAGCEFLANNPGFVITSLNEGVSYPASLIVCSPTSLKGFGYELRGSRWLCPVTCGCKSVAQSYQNDGKPWTEAIGVEENCPKSCFNYNVR